MKQLFFFMVCFLWLLVLPFHTKAQVTDSPVLTVEPPQTDSLVYDEDEQEGEVEDTALYSKVIFFPADSFRIIREQKEFSYGSNLDSLLKELQEEELKKFRQQSQPVNPNWFGKVLKFVLWLFVALGVVFLIYKLFLADGGLFAASQKNKSITIHKEETGDEASLLKQLDEAVKKGNFRGAIRFSYLLSLFQLAQKGLITLSPDKTNFQYVRELPRTNLQDRFARITLYYEYAWYGNFKMEAESYQTIKKEFDLFLNILRQS